MNNNEKIEEVFLKFGYPLPKRWDSRKRKMYYPKTDCFAYFPSLDANRNGKCSALNRLYCIYEEECSFYKQFDRKVLYGDKDKEED